MPVYEFRCPDDHEETFDVICGYEEPLVIPWCVKHSRSMIRKYTPPAIQFRGSGFYSRGG